MQGSIRTTTLTIDTVGGDAAATGTASTGDLFGELLDIYINYVTAVATTDITISESVFGAIYAKADSVTDVRIAPRMATVGPTGSALAWFDRYPLSGPITVLVEGSNALAGAVIATIRWLSY